MCVFLSNYPPPFHGSHLNTGRPDVEQVYLISKLGSPYVQICTHNAPPCCHSVTMRPCCYSLTMRPMLSHSQCAPCCHSLTMRPLLSFTHNAPRVVTHSQCAPVPGGERAVVGQTQRSAAGGGHVVPHSHTHHLRGPRRQEGDMGTSCTKH